MIYHLYPLGPHNPNSLGNPFSALVHVIGLQPNTQFTTGLFGPSLQVSSAIA